MAQIRTITDEYDASEEQVRYRAGVATWEAQVEALGKRTMGDVETRWDASVTAQTAAENRLLAYPAPDAAALTYKMAVIERSYRGCDLDEKIMAHVFADARRLLTMEG